MKETYFNEKLEKVSFKRRKDSLLYSRLYSLAASRVYPFCNLQSWARAHGVLVMGLYELLDPTT
jgi:hypothetical protein